MISIDAVGFEWEAGSLRAQVTIPFFPRSEWVRVPDRLCHLTQSELLGSYHWSSICGSCSAMPMMLHNLARGMPVPYCVSQ